MKLVSLFHKYNGQEDYSPIYYGENGHIFKSTWAVEYNSISDKDLVSLFFILNKKTIYIVSSNEVIKIERETLEREKISLELFKNLLTLR